MNGKPYGYHNMLVSWIDTIGANYPPPLDAHVLLFLKRARQQTLDPISSSIHVTEFTIKDAYSLRFFENRSSRLPKWCDDGDDVELLVCQIRGWYRMELPGYNTVDLYPHMKEMCPSLAPKYSKPSSC
ncbi:hypothetical protein EUGRSUZ_L02722 [Eucalyptus grandis]|uniref:Uncharacterized protein n=1 Tax=Eucalyptus grandis TaxID=71139 RepID=A0AAD9WID0_EUCGR|nr:hypothetical protein EUGRSUZ_L02722 [Eucalyptus grandis]